MTHHLIAAAVCVLSTALLWRKIEDIGRLSVVMLVVVLVTVGWVIIAGLFTRPTAFVLSGLMAFAYFIGHAAQGNALLPILNGGELAALYSFLFLLISVVGAGSWAVDNVLRRRADQGAVAVIEAVSVSVR